MKSAVYMRLAKDSVIKNKQVYFPYILANICMAAMYYIITYLQHSTALENTGGYDTICVTLNFGSWVIAIFSCIFSFYTNAFIMRRRKKEFGLYNILGMDKHNISKILLIESISVALICILSGIISGILISKLDELILCRLMNGEITYSLNIAPAAVIYTAVVYIVIHTLLYFNSVRQIRFSTAVTLLKSENLGEKPPRANYFFGVAGILLLAAAYYFAATIKDPVAAISLFFAAVIAVIIATYMIMISGSVLLCKTLQRNQGYYYKSKHFISVSSMTYRMKRNGAGLASVCILATMVLVMISSTSCLFFGTEDAVNKHCPRQINISLQDDISFYENKTESIDEMRKLVNEESAKYGTALKDAVDFRSISLFAYFENGKCHFSSMAGSDALSHSLVAFSVIPLEDFNKATGGSYSLSNNEAYVIPSRTKYSDDKIVLTDDSVINVKSILDAGTLENLPQNSVYPIITVIVPDIANAEKTLYNNIGENKKSINSSWTYCFDTDLSEAEQVNLANSLKSGNNAGSAVISSKVAYRQDFKNSFCSFFFLGIMLSSVFICATVLIIYYKQITEGYEDRTRFSVMKKIGITDAEIKKSINSQLLTVFFAPLLLSGIHLCFAFPMIRKLLLLFGFSNTGLFITAAVISFVVFALLYTLIYRITTKTYYNIVNSNNI